MARALAWQAQGTGFNIQHHRIIKHIKIKYENKPINNVLKIYTQSESLGDDLVDNGLLQKHEALSSDPQLHTFVNTALEDGGVAGRFLELAGQLH